MAHNKRNMPLAALFWLAIAVLTAACTASPNSAGIESEDENMYAIIDTTLGTIKVKLDKDKAPITVENFRRYAETGFYEGTVFHRVIPGFMVQGGGFTASGEQKQPMAPIKNEAKNMIPNRRGTIAMARTNVIDSATSQFFINVADNAFLNYKDDSNYGYAVFGEVISGMEVVDKITSLPTSSRGFHDDWPTQDIIIRRVTVSEN